MKTIKKKNTKSEAESMIEKLIRDANRNVDTLDIAYFSNKETGQRFYVLTIQQLNRFGVSFSEGD